MPNGRLEVNLIEAKGLESTEFFCNMDPYVILTCRTQEQQSKVATGGDTAPKWNETIVFTINGHVPEMHVKIMDKDTVTADDFVGEANIPLEPVYEEGYTPPTAYNVVKDGEFKGEIKISLAFTPQERGCRGYGVPEEELGGWKQSYRDY